MSSTPPNHQGLDYDFLRYMGVQPETQRQIQEYYLPYFRQCNKVVDLGCGDGDFVKLMLDNDIGVTGVDNDAKSFESSSQRNLPVVQADVFDYLRQSPPASVDGIFCAHLVEHLPYEKVIELIQLSHRVLKEDGIILLATPDVRSLFSHLEMYYLHFGHVSFYHPRLLCFFLDHAGFVNTQYGANPNTASPLLPALRQIPSDNTPSAQVTYHREIPQQGSSILHRLSYRVKRSLTGWLVQPFLDDLTLNVNCELERLHAEINTDLRGIADALQSLNGPFECYALARKSSDHEHVAPLSS